MPTKKNAFSVEFVCPEELRERMAAAAASTGQYRTHWIVDTIRARLDSGIATIDRQRIPATVSKVLRATNGKLSRIECEQIVSLCIIGLTE
jgi:hypothetical protein